MTRSVAVHLKVKIDEKGVERSRVESFIGYYDSSFLGPPFQDTDATLQTATMRARGHLLLCPGPRCNCLDKLNVSPLGFLVKFRNIAFGTRAELLSLRQDRLFPRLRRCRRRYP